MGKYFFCKRCGYLTDDLKPLNNLLSLFPSPNLANFRRLRFTPAPAEAGVDISDADAAVGDVKTGKTFYSVAVPRKTGTMDTVAIVAANSNYPAGYHAGNVGGLEAIDADLAVGNIKSGVTIFGKLGTYTGVVSSDEQTFTQGSGGILSGLFGCESGLQAAGEVTLSTQTVTPDTATNVVFAYAFGGKARGTGTCYLRLYKGGEKVGETESPQGTIRGLGYTTTNLAAPTTFYTKVTNSTDDWRYWAYGLHVALAKI